MNEKELEALRDEYLSAAEPIRRRIEDLQARVDSVRGKERIANPQTDSVPYRRSLDAHRRGAENSGQYRRTHEDLIFHLPPSRAGRAIPATLPIREVVISRGSYPRNRWSESSIGNQTHYIYFFSPCTAGCETTPIRVTEKGIRVTAGNRPAICGEQ